MDASSSISLRISRIIDEFFNGNKSEFARIAGIAESNVRSYLSGSIPKADVLEKIAQNTAVSCEWLLTGSGAMVKPAKNRFSQMTEQEIEEITKATISDELVKAYQRGEIYPASIHDKIVAEKNAEIKEKETQIGELQRRVWELEQKAGKKE